MIIPLSMACRAGATLSLTRTLSVILCQLGSRKFSHHPEPMILSRRRQDTLSLKLTQLRSAAKRILLRPRKPELPAYRPGFSALLEADRIKPK
jgi:hypothetical protein